MKKFGWALLAIAMLAAGDASAQNAPQKFLSAATNNSTLVRAGKISLGTISATNTTATAAFLKLYDKATAPVCGTDIPKWTIPLPVAANGGGHADPNLVTGVWFTLGLGFCIVGGIADNDNTASVVGIAVNIGFSLR